MDLNLANEVSIGLDDAEKKDSNRDTDCGINAILDGGEYGDQHTRKEDDDFDGVDAPELVDGVWRSDQIAHCVDDNGGEC